MLEKYKGDARVRVVAVATAFEKDKYPFMSDEGKIREMLKQKKYEFAVMRDRDEKSVRMFGVGNSYGTPMTVVLDREGVVRWHGFNGQAETAKAIEDTVAKLVAAYDAPAMEIKDKGLAACAKAYAAGDFGKAYTEAKAASGKVSVSADGRAEAMAVMKALEEASAKAMAEAQAKRDGGHPADALARLERMGKTYKGVPKTQDPADLLKKWKADDEMKKEQKAEEGLNAILAALGAPNADPAVLAKDLDKLAETHRGTKVAERIKSLSALLR
ncbi:MAG: hypothetical protein FD180_2448 [Planctomycetota bacterium]|nr:MAG: hypothetical protein FD180_2448 [Planctomycetota bacterium]